MPPCSLSHDHMSSVLKSLYCSSSLGSSPPSPRDSTFTLRPKSYGERAGGDGGMRVRSEKGGRVSAPSHSAVPLNPGTPHSNSCRGGRGRERGMGGCKREKEGRAGEGSVVQSPSPKASTEQSPKQENKSEGPKAHYLYCSSDPPPPPSLPTLNTPSSTLTRILPVVSICAHRKVEGSVSGGGRGGDAPSMVIARLHMHRPCVSCSSTPMHHVPVLSHCLPGPPMHRPCPARQIRDAWPWLAGKHE